MSNTIELTGELYEKMRRHLLQSDQENVAFMFARVEDFGGSLRFIVVDLHLVPPDGFTLQSGHHVSLTDQELAAIIKESWERGLALIEAHSHPDPRFPAAFSWSDLRGFEEVVPHVFWRLRGTPYAALVFAPSGFDALVWRAGPDEAEPLSELRVDGRPLAPTDSTFNQLRSEHGYRAI